MKIVVNHIIISAEISGATNPDGSICPMRPISLIFKQADLSSSKTPGIIHDIFSLAKRHVFYSLAPPPSPDQHSLPSQGRGGERSS